MGWLGADWCHICVRGFFKKNNFLFKKIVTFLFYFFFRCRSFFQWLWLSYDLSMMSLVCEVFSQRVGQMAREWRAALWSAPSPRFFVASSRRIERTFDRTIMVTDLQCFLWSFFLNTGNSTKLRLPTANYGYSTKLL